MTGHPAVAANRGSGLCRAGLTRRSSARAADTLASGRLVGAALDVFEREADVPADPHKDLRKLDNVVLTPHVGSNTREANGRMGGVGVG
jgi:phosphoglycerate dehydrogenase-like enzyme